MESVLRIQIRKYEVRIRILLKTFKKPWFLLFCNFFMSFIFKKQKHIEKKLFLVAVLKVSDENSRMRIRSLIR